MSSSSSRSTSSPSRPCGSIPPRPKSRGETARRLSRIQPSPRRLHWASTREPTPRRRSGPGRMLKTKSFGSFGRARSSRSCGRARRPGGHCASRATKCCTKSSTWRHLTRRPSCGGMGGAGSGKRTHNRRRAGGVRRSRPRSMLCSTAPRNPKNRRYTPRSAVAGDRPSR